MGVIYYKGILYGGSGGSGHTMSPNPDPNLTDDEIADAIDSAIGTNDEVASLYGIQRWSNTKTFRAVLTQGIGHYGVGEWQDSLSNPTEAQEIQWGWWKNNIFKYLDPSFSQQNGYDVDIKFGFDPKTGEIITLGGYLIDTTTGYICIKFANYVVNIADAKIIVDVTITRNDIIDTP